MNRAQKRIEEYISTFRYYQIEIKNILETEEKKKSKRTATIHLSPLVGIPKSTVKDVQNMYNSFKREESSINNLDSSFNRGFYELEESLKGCVILEDHINVSAKKPKTYVSKVHSVSTLGYKVKHTHEGLQKLKLLGNKLVLNEDIPTPKKKSERTMEMEEPISFELAIHHWKDVLSNDIDFAFSID